MHLYHEHERKMCDWKTKVYFDLDMILSFLAATLRNSWKVDISI